MVHGFSPTAARRAAFAERFDFPLCDSLETVVRDDSVDSVIVLMPANTHLEIVRRCAEAGKNVLLEKPVEITTERATAFVDIRERACVTLGIVLQHRFRSAGMSASRESVERTPEPEPLHPDRPPNPCPDQKAARQIFGMVPCRLLGVTSGGP